MDIVNNVSWITDRELGLLKAQAARSFTLGDFSSLDNILTALKIVVIIEPDIAETQNSPVLKRSLEYWEREAERLKKCRKSDACSNERYQEALRNIEELNNEIGGGVKYFAGGVYDAKEKVIKLYPDRMRRKLDGHRLDELLVLTLAHETMHAYFSRKGFDGYPSVSHIEEPLAEFGMLLFLYETDCGLYQWAYDDVKNKKSCYRYGAMLMDQHLKAGSASPERRFLERYPVRLNPHTMFSVKNGAVTLPSGSSPFAPIDIDGHKFRPRWEDVYKRPPRYYYDEQTGTLCLDGYWGKFRMDGSPDIVIDGKIELVGLEIKHLYLGDYFDTDNIRTVYPLFLCPVYVSPLNMVFAEVNNIPVYRKDNKPALRPCDKGLYVICRNGQSGVIDDNLNQVVPFKYDGMGAFDRNGLMGVSLRQKDGMLLYGAVNRQWVEQIPVVYEYMHRNRTGTYTVKKDGEEYTIDKFGNRV